MVLELGNLWYNRYLLCDGQGVRFLADEALDAALRYYRESRELCIDLVADSGEGAGGHGGGAAAAGATAAASGCLLRAEYNVGMSLLEQEKRTEAERHLSAAVSIFRDVFAAGAPKEAESESAPPAGAGAGAGAWGAEAGGGVTAVARDSRASMAAWKAAVLVQEDLAGLGGVYASSLFLLAECVASSSSSSSREGGPVEAVAGTLQASAEAFLDIGDPARALDPLLKLVEVLRRSDDDDNDDGGNDDDDRDRGGEVFLSAVEALCHRVALGLPGPAEDAPGAAGGGSGGDGGGDDPEEERLQLEQVRGEIADLRAHRGGGVVSSERSERGQQEVVASPLHQQKRGGVSDGADETPLRRVGPAPTAGFAQRRRRLRVSTAATLSGGNDGGGGGGGGGRKVLGVTSRNNAPVRRQAAAVAVASAEAGGGSVADGRLPDVRGGVGPAAGEGSFAGLRGAVAAEDGAATVLAAAAIAGAAGDGAPGGAGPRERRPAFYSSYREKVRSWLRLPRAGEQKFFHGRVSMLH